MIKDTIIRSSSSSSLYTDDDNEKKKKPRNNPRESLKKHNPGKTALPVSTTTTTSKASPRLKRNGSEKKALPHDDPVSRGEILRKIMINVNKKDIYQLPEPEFCAMCSEKDSERKSFCHIGGNCPHFPHLCTRCALDLLQGVTTLTPSSSTKTQSAAVNDDDDDDNDNTLVICHESKFNVMKVGCDLCKIHINPRHEPLPHLLPSRGENLSPHTNMTLPPHPPTTTKTTTTITTATTKSATKTTTTTKTTPPPPPQEQQLTRQQQALFCVVIKVIIAKMKPGRFPAFLSWVEYWENLYKKPQLRLCGDLALPGSPKEFLNIKRVLGKSGAENTLDSFLESRKKRRMSSLSTINTALV
jgi:hypothetical protein